MGLFWLGGSAGYFIKMMNNKARRQHVFHRPWEFPIYMLVGGIFFVYFDWYRRIALEKACEFEEKVQPTIEAQKIMVQDVFLRKPSLNYEKNH